MSIQKSFEQDISTQTNKKGEVVSWASRTPLHPPLCIFNEMGGPEIFIPPEVQRCLEDQQSSRSGKRSKGEQKRKGKKSQKKTRSKIIPPPKKRKKIPQSRLWAFSTNQASSTARASSNISSLTKFLIKKSVGGMGCSDGPQTWSTQP